MTRRLLDAAISVVTALLAMGAAFTASWLTAFGPVTAPERWFATSLSASLWLLAYVLVLAGAARYFDSHGPWMLAVGASFLSLGFAIFQVGFAVEHHAFRVRGEVTSCTVTAIEKRVHSSHDGGATRTFYIHELDCSEPHVSTMTTGAPVADVGAKVQVRYDPTGRVDPRPAEWAIEPERAFRRGLVALAIAVAARILLELFASQRNRGGPFFGHLRGFERIRKGVTVLGGGVAVVVVLGTSAQALHAGTTTTLRLVGTPDELLRNPWATWPATVALALVLNHLLGLCRWLMLRAVRRIPGHTEPDSVLGDLVAAAEVRSTIELPLPRRRISVDTGLLGWMWDTWRTRSDRRHRLRRRRDNPSGTPAG